MMKPFIMKPFLIFQGPVATRSGYGSHSRDLLRSLIAMDKFDIKVISLRWGSTPMDALTDSDSDITSLIHIREQGNLPTPDIFVQVSVPNEFQPIGKFNIGITAGMETTLVHQEWLEGCNRMDLIIVPSTHSKQVLIDTVYSKMDGKKEVAKLKLTTPIDVLFEGVDTNIYKQTTKLDQSVVDELGSIPEDFCFLQMGHWLQGDFGHDRKDISGCIKTFCKTFEGKKGPAMILKTSSATFSIIDRQNMLVKINNIKSEFSNPPNIYLLHGNLTDSEINSLYNHPKVKAMVSFTHGEGYGRPLAEFGTSGKPIMSSWWSGHKDFLKHSIRLVGQTSQLHDSSVWDKVLLKESHWFFVNYRFAGTMFKTIYNKYKKYEQAGKRQKYHISNYYSIEKMNKKFLEIITNRIPKPSHEKKLNLPSFDPIELPKLQKSGE